ncbi:sensor histidine kinase [Flavitalea sp. BT771]|uniref:tetratricopeptide repeat-containing sensor histidine kinase n=1 Tax=Flavitalea sp. BT771 TaxID=3063329 RepID=UPI0026E233A1|nr:sensor histidine kinase [Flavitalea sp. BT771]MDO6430230.1 sensor histidine kinase [Flavitalea sp. BT771]MDV6219630.1 sensor histidine kinase [Flavitalea sp. BT771]
MKSILSPVVLLFVLILSASALSQPVVHDSPRYLLPLLAKSKPDTNRVALLNRLAGYYIFKPGNYKDDLDSAMGNLDDALALSRRLGSPYWVNETLKLKADCYLESNGAEDLPKGGNCFREVADYYRRIGDIPNEARLWRRYAECLVYTHYQDKTCCLVKALALYEQLSPQYQEEVIRTLEILADNHLAQGRLDSAETELLEVVTRYKSIGFRHLQDSYDLLAHVYRLRGFPQKWLQYRLQCMQAMYDSGDTSAVVQYALATGSVYLKMGFNEKALYYFDKVLHHKLRTDLDSLNYFEALVDKAILLANTGHARESIQLLDESTKAGWPASPYYSILLNSAYVESYKTLGQFAAAEKYYFDARRLFSGEDGYDILGTAKLVSTGLSLVDLYLKMGRLNKARSMMQSIGVVRFASLAPDELGLYYFAKFKLDSAAGNYTSAIRHYTQYKQLTDSIFNATKNRQVQELEISYETKQKEASITDLQGKGKVRQAELNRSNAQKRLILVGSGLLLVIAILAFIGFRQKQRSNRLLLVHQKEIDEKNLSLESLNYRQGLLLKEKEWFVREIHHRVKNNLQTTISLLHMQSTYLTNEQAITAIRNSQHRLQAMSLIHQRLYQSEDMTSIEMFSYITELVSFLRESHRGIDNIAFDFQIDPVVFDIGMAIPLGLTINEAVTNSIKYAFPNDRQGKVSISLRVSDGDNYVLVVRDNGIGLYSGYRSPQGQSSLGLDLIRGLTDQIQGRVQIEGHDGTSITLCFNTSAPYVQGPAAEHALI